jgi:hypothetical protein
VAIELALAAASAKPESEVIIEVAVVVEKIEAVATDALEGVLSCEGDHHRRRCLAVSLFGCREPSRKLGEAKLRV